MCAASLGLALIGLTMIAGAQGRGYVFVIAAIIIGWRGGLVVSQLMPAKPGDADHAQREGIARELERIEDAHWQLTDNEARYLDLLDTQDNMISRRDAEGRLVFANRAFGRAFAVNPKDALGHPFERKALEGGPAEVLTLEGVRRRAFVERAQTTLGPRWIAWEETLIPTGGHAFEIQSVGRDVTAARQTEMDLKEARDQADAANRAKSRFLAAMSHEIRTPMNGILGMAGLLRDTPQSSEQKIYTSAVDQSARALLALIDEILDFSKIEAGRLDLACTPFSLHTCLESAVTLLAPRANEKGLSLVWSIDEGVPAVVAGDEARVRQIVLNLVSNAVKFTDHGGVTIAVSLTGPVQATATRIAIEVADTGIGLTPEDMKRLFDEFEQTETALNRREGGTGLGLAISKRLARAMDGDIVAEGCPGTGATFTAILRLDRVSDDPATQPHAQRSRLSLEGAGPTSCPSPVRKRILVAEDNEINALLARRVVEKAGCEVVVVGNGQDAIAAVQRELQPGGRPFDLVLMDVFMPRVDGLEATRAIRRLFAGGSSEPGRPPIIIALTANAFAEDRRQCLVAGMDGFLSKPFDAGQLLDVLKTRLDRPPPADPQAEVHPAA